VLICEISVKVFLGSTPHPGPLSEPDWPLDQGGGVFSQYAYCKLSCKLIENVSAAHWIIKEIGVACLRLKGLIVITLNQTGQKTFNQ
jgi:hypothetical protein